MAALKPHHLAWLETRAHRSAEWLRSRLRDGFDVHHMDGDHSNNDPANLVLIEHTDHMRLHGMVGVLGRLSPRKGPRGPHKRKKPTAPKISRAPAPDQSGEVFDSAVPLVSRVYSDRYVLLPDGREIRIFHHETSAEVLRRHAAGSLHPGRYNLMRAA